ncbi:MAG: hypothetical protein KTR15_11640 [Phycisphaeraceae bacterium]|nr:hypothetical protein [Phycisphaeraceae bacterium]
MATISSIVSKLTLDTSQFNTRLQRSRRRAKAWGRDLKRIGKRVGIAVAAGGAIAAVGLAAMTSRQLEQIDSSAKFARSIDLQVEKLAGLRHAADLNGVGADKFDKSLQRMVRSIGDANSRGGTLKQVFDDLGVSSEELATMSPDEQLATLADAFSGVEDRSMAASMAQQIFGREGTAMLNLLNQGSDVFRESQAEIDKYSAALTAVDAAAVEEAVDNFGRLKLKINGVQQSITADLAPYLTSISEQILNVQTDSIETTSIISSGLRFVGKAVALVANTVDVFRLAWKTLEVGATATVAAITHVVEKLSDAVEAVAQALGFEYETPQWLKDFNDELERTTLELADEGNQMFKDLVNNKRGQDIDAFFDRIEEGAEKARQAAREAAEATEQQTEAVETASVAYEEQLENVEKVKKTLTDLQRQLDRFGLNDQQIKLFDLEALGASADEIEKARSTMEKLRQLEEQRDRGNTIAGIVEDLEKQVRLFGLSEDEKTLLNLEALGAGDDQIRRAVEAIKRRQELEKESQLNSPLRSASGPSLVRAGSAAAQAAAFSAQRAVDPQLAEQKKQTDLQKRMADGIDRLTEQGARVSAAPAIMEVGIQ